MKPFYENEAAGVVLYCGRAEDVLPGLGTVDAIISDPPYGMDWDGRITRGKNGTGKAGPTRSYGKTIEGDRVPFDPTPFLEYPRVVLWGFQHFARTLPVGTTLVWIKRYDDGFGSFLSDADLAWMKGGHGVYCRRDLSLQGDSRNRRHPTEKPVGIMAWCIEKAGCDLDEMICDPFMGSGTTGVACVRLGRKFTGIECEERYAEIAARRIQTEIEKGCLFDPRELEATAPRQLAITDTP